MDMVASGLLRQGFMLLSRTVVAQWAADTGRADDLARLTARCFLPPDSGGSDSLNLARRLTVALRCSDIGGDEAEPVAAAWRVLARPGNDSTMPIFVFSTQYSLRAPLRMRIPMLGDTGRPRLAVNLSPAMSTVVRWPLYWDPDAPRRPVEVGILVDCTQDKRSLDEYLGDAISYRYDEISEAHKEPRPGVLWLRCRNGVYRNRVGESCTYLAFDRTVRAQVRSAKDKVKGGKAVRPQALKVRYVIAARGSSSVEEKADAVLEILAKRFGL
jgi:hypothetical protein